MEQENDKLTEKDRDYEAPKTGETNISNIEGLSVHDRQLLFESGKNVLTYILNDFPSQLPDIVLLPDTSARPLAYLLEPSLSLIARERNLPAPQFVFIKPQSDEHTFAVSEMKNRQQTMDANLALNQERQHLEEIKEEHVLTGSSWTDPIYAQTQLDRYEKATSKTREVDQIYKDRVQEIRERLGKPDAHFIIVDEYATAMAKTLNGIHHGVGEDIHLYALMGSSEEGLAMEGIKLGVIDPESERGVATKGFDYKQKSKREAIGVNKDEDIRINRYAEKNEASHESKHNLRQGMREIGKKIAVELAKTVPD